jgi:hypothetical protein
MHCSVAALQPDYCYPYIPFYCLSAQTGALLEVRMRKVLSVSSFAKEELAVRVKEGVPVVKHEMIPLFLLSETKQLCYCCSGIDTKPG